MTELVLDTSVAVPLLVTSHVAHRSVSAALGDRAAALAGHALHETYAVLTRLPGDARVAPADAVRLLRERFESAALLDSRSVRSAPAVLAAAGVAGGATYDGLVALAARSAGLPLATRDRRAQSTYRLLDVAVELLV
ncbi:MAG: PIN domain-containing protein [Microthrixaceae bacterium]|nr:PIN domain-containing protein [Microthrixaceae bacterium]MCB9401573.1 PIN domain-containing protein [Microthrixaceae bacterium]MCO5305046.1 PIN domain-containing protein [Microthrixaceae bacterium]